MKNVIRLLQEYWKLTDNKPSLCVSIIGGAKSFKLEGKKKVVFCRGLIRAVRITNAWILTSGLFTGIVAQVSEAINSAEAYFTDQTSIGRPITCLGISPWGYVRNWEQLIINDAERILPAAQRYQLSCEVVARREPLSLDKNHTHYILVDNGLRKSFIKSNVMEFRASLEREIKTGGYDVLKQADLCVSQGIPIIICKGTGRVADILVKALEIWRKRSNVNQTCPENYTSEGDLDFTEEDKNVLTKLLSDQLELAETSMKEKGKQASECLQHLRKIMQNCHLLTTFDFGSIGVSSTEDDAPIFDEAILQALIKSATVDPFEQLEFALKFNQIKFVRERLVHNFDQFKSSDRAAKFGDLMKMALLSDRVEFVEFFINHDLVDVPIFLTSQILEDLYKSSDIFLFKNLKNPAVQMIVSPIWRLLHSKLREFDDKFYIQVSENSLFAHPFQELFIWSVLRSFHEMAVLILRYADDPIGLGLVGCMLYDRMADALPSYDTEGREHLKARKRYFETSATALLNVCYAKSQKATLYLLLQPFPRFGRNNCMDLAMKSNCRLFLSTNACQHAIRDEWRKKTDFGVCRKAIPFDLSPRNSFYIRWAFYFAFMAFFAWTLLFGMRDLWHPGTLVVCFAFFIVDSINKSLILLESGPLLIQLKRAWEHHGWHLYDLFLLAPSLASSLAWFTSTDIILIRRLYTLTFVLYLCRIFKMYSYFSQLGPKIVMILKMLTELCLFLCIMLVPFVAHGVSSVALLYPHRNNSHYGETLRHVLYYPYFRIYGELFLDLAEGEKTGCGDPSDGINCPVKSVLPVLLLGTYMFLMAILFVNLLIAIFNNVYTEVQAESIQRWKAKQYNLLVEYKVACRALTMRKRQTTTQNIDVPQDQDNSHDTEVLPRLAANLQRFAVSTFSDA